MFGCFLKRGGLAQLARAFGWQPKGHRFDSDILHKTEARQDQMVFASFLLFLYGPH